MVNIRVPVPKVLKKISRPFHCLMQDPSSSRSFYSIQPYWYSRKKDQFEAFMDIMPHP